MEKEIFCFAIIYLSYFVRSYILLPFRGWGFKKTSPPVETAGLM
jgi:hypothetical protein